MRACINIKMEYTTLFIRWFSLFFLSVCAFLPFFIFFHPFRERRKDGWGKSTNGTGLVRRGIKFVRPCKPIDNNVTLQYTRIFHDVRPRLVCVYAATNAFRPCPFTLYSVRAEQYRNVSRGILCTYTYWNASACVRVPYYVLRVDRCVGQYIVMI